MAERAIILFAHGARDPEWARPFMEIKRRLAARQPGIAIELAFLEIMQPTLENTVARLALDGCKSITIAPLFMAQGGHLKNDLPKILEAARARHHGVELTLLPAIGDAAPVIDAITDWLVSATAH